jgi:hypothetical protein
VEFVVDEMTKKKVFSKYLGLTLPFTARRCSIFLFQVTGIT